MNTSHPEKIGRYQVVERVGRGAMGVLFRGIDSVLDREVAIKLMLMDFSEDEEQLRTRFYREARAIAKLQHRNIVTVFEFAEEDQTPYIVMEFLRGSSLQARMASPLPLTLEAKLNIVAQLCEALHYAHEQGVVHRDVKPANLFLLNDGSVKLLDFGIAKVETSTLTKTRDVLGSVAYMSPEQVAGSSMTDGRSDIFSTGVLLYELLSGRKPFDSEAPTATIVKILHDPPPPLGDLIQGLPAQLIAAVNRSLEKKAEDRFQTGADFARELQSIRKALVAAGEGAAALEETRFASPAEVEKFTQPGAASSSQTSTSSTGDVVAPGRPRWIIPAAVGAVAMIGVVAVMLGRGGSPAKSPAAQPAVAVSTPAASTAPAPAPAAPGPAPAGQPAAAAKLSTVETASLASVSVRVETDPAGAAITLDGQNTSLSTPASLTIKGGVKSHRLRLSKRGFATQDVTLTPDDARRGALNYTLAPVSAAMVPVSISSTYPVDVVNNGKSIGSGESHQLNLPAGSTVRIVSPQYLLDAAVKIEGTNVDYQAPPLGYLTVLTKYETCNVKIGLKDLGYPPITKLPLASGAHRVDIACPNGTNPPSQIATITPNSTFTVRIY